MKKTLIVIIGLLLLGTMALLWLANSVGPETAPQDVRSIEVDIDG